MELKRIDLFLPRFSQYQVLHYFTRRMEEAFQACGVRTRLLSLGDKERDKEKDKGQIPTPALDLVAKELLADPPDLIFSFNAIMPPKQPGTETQGALALPYFTLLVDSAHYYLPLTNYPNIIPGFVDRSGVDFFREHNSPRGLFVPHGVESTLVPDPTLPKKYDAVFLATLTDYEAIRTSWQTRFSADQCKVIDYALQLAFQDPSTPYYRLVTQALQKLKIDPASIKFGESTTAVETYLRGKERIDLLRSISKVQVHLFGAGGEENCKKYLAHRTNIVAHPPLSYEEALHVMKQSKIVLHICSWIKHGGHERIFAAPACGALLATPPNPYLQEYFHDGQSILYMAPQFQDLDEALLEYLNNESKRAAIVEQGRSIVMQNHTWEVRARSILCL